MPTELEKTEAAVIRALGDPAPPPKFPPPPTAEQIKRLARLERQLVDREVAAKRLDPLAMQILVLRAEING